MNAADYEARRARLEREREAGLAFTQMLRERLEAECIPIESLTKPEEPEAGARERKAG
jgi:hypothetical protein